MKKIKTVDAVGTTLVQDITRIIVGKTKEVAFSRGHVVCPEDIDVLLALGKDHLFTAEESDKDKMHEEDVAVGLWQLCESENIARGPLREGKIEAVSKIDGLLDFNEEKLQQINSIGEITIVTLPRYKVVRKGDKVAGMRCIPLLLPKEEMEAAERIAAREALLQILPFYIKKAGLIITGSEVYEGRIEEAFTPLVKERLDVYGVEIKARCIVPDNKEVIAKAIETMYENGVDIIFCTGGMSVDPDDLTPGAIRQCATEFITHGLPVLPGSMFCIAYKGGVPLIGLPGGVLFSHFGAFDLLLPRFLARKKMSKEDCIALWQGGLL